MKITNHILKLQGKAESPAPIEIGNNYHVSMQGAVISTTDTDNDDGTLTRSYVFKPIKVEILDQTGKTIPLKDSRSNSQLIRALIYKRWVNAASSLSFDEYYDAVCREIMLQVDVLVDQAEKHKRL